MPDLLFAVPGDLATPTGGYAYARRLLALLPSRGIETALVTLPGSFPAPSAADVAETAATLAALPAGTPLLVDGLAYGALEPATIAAAGRRSILALVHHPLGLEEGLAEKAARAAIARERVALALATRVVVTSAFTGRLLAERFDVPAERIHVAPPGTEPPPVRQRTVADAAAPIHLLAVGAVTPRKGFDVLVRALTSLADRRWRTTIVGALDRAPDHVADLRRLIAAAGLGDRVRLAGAVAPEALATLYGEADVAVSSSLFEGYGMALAEALARGLPVVMARGGAADETVPDAAALKVAPGDASALAEALASLLADPALRERLAAASREAGRALPRWEETARIVAAAVAAAARP